MKSRLSLALTLTLNGIGLAATSALGCASITVDTVETVPQEAGIDALSADGNSRKNACTDCEECAAQRQACLDVPLCRASGECTADHNCYALPQREFFDCATQCAIEVGITNFGDPAALLGYAHYQCLVNSSCRAACIGDQ